MKNRFLAIVLIGVFLMSCLAACGEAGSPPQEQKEQTQEQNNEPIKIGFSAPLTGPVAAEGESVLTAARLAIEHINRDGGIGGREVELVYYDEGMDPKQAVNISHKLIDKDKVTAAVCGSYSGLARAMAPIFQKAKIPMISAYGIHPDITRAGDYVFRQSFVGTVQGKAAAHVARYKLGTKKVAILHMDNDFGITLAESFGQKAKELGLTVTSVNSFAMGEKEFTPLLTKISQENPDTLYMACYANEGAQIIRQADALGLNYQLLGCQGLDSVQFQQIVGKDADGLIITTNFDRDSELPLVKNFIEDYTDLLGFAPDMVAVSVYDAFSVLAEAMRISGTTPELIRDGIYQIKDFPTASGVIMNYNQLGEVVKAVQVQVVRDGEFHYYDRVDDPDIIAPPEE